MTNDIIYIADFFNGKELEEIEKIINSLPNQDVIPSYGPFENQLLANFVELKNSNKVMELLIDKIKPLIPCKQFSISRATRTKLFLPWDIHNDLRLEEVEEGYTPWYNFLISLEDVESRTILFDQWSESYSDFYLYKQEHDKLSIPIDETFWQENLSMCWPEDRFYLSVKQVLPYQRRGALQGFHRKYFHSSDNFHMKNIAEKSFIQIRLDIKL